MSTTESRILKKATLKWLEAAPINWQRMVDKNLTKTTTNGGSYLYELASFLRSLTVHSVRLMEYVEARYNHQGAKAAHQQSVRASNDRVRKVRKALGYTQADDLWF